MEQLSLRLNPPVPLVSEASITMSAAIMLPLLHKLVTRYGEVAVLLGTELTLPHSL